MSGGESREIIAYIRERDEAREELKKAQDELLATKSKLYDANNKVSDLEERVCILLSCTRICVFLLQNIEGTFLSSRFAFSICLINGCFSFGCWSSIFIKRIIYNFF